MKPLGVSAFLGYFIVLFCVMVSYRICDSGNLKVSLQSYNLSCLMPDVCLWIFCCTPVVHGAYFEGSVNVPSHINNLRLGSYILVGV